MFKLLLQELRSRRYSILGWGFGLCFFPVVYVGLFPTFAEQMGVFNEMLDLPIYQALGMSMGTFEEYMASTVTNLVPLIMSIFTISTATATLVGEEDSGRLELIVTLPIPRWQIVAVKAIALGISSLIILAIVSAGASLTLLAISSQIEAIVTPAEVFLSLLSAWPLVLAIGMVGLFMGTFSPSRRIATGITTVVVLASYLGSNLSGMIDSLNNVKNAFIFTFYDATAKGLTEGQASSDQFTLLLISIIAFGLAVLFFQLRNITVGAWPWQRGIIKR